MVVVAGCLRDRVLNMQGIQRQEGPSQGKQKSPESCVVYMWVCLVCGI